MRIGSGEHTYEWIEDWAKIPDSASARNGWAHPGLAVGGDGQIYTFHQGDPTVLVFEPSGDLIGTIDTGLTEGHGNHGVPRARDRLPLDRRSGEQADPARRRARHGHEGARSGRQDLPRGRGRPQGRAAGPPDLPGRAVRADGGRHLRGGARREWRRLGRRRLRSEPRPSLQSLRPARPVPRQHRRPGGIGRRLRLPALNLDRLPKARPRALRRRPDESAHPGLRPRRPLQAGVRPGHLPQPERLRPGRGRPDRRRAPRQARGSRPRRPAHPLPRPERVGLPGRGLAEHAGRSRSPDEDEPARARASSTARTAWPPTPPAASTSPSG